MKLYYQLLASHRIMQFHLLLLCLVASFAVDVSSIMVPVDNNVPYMFPPGYGRLDEDDGTGTSSFTPIGRRNVPFDYERQLEAMNARDFANGYYSGTPQLAVDASRGMNAVLTKPGGPMLQQPIQYAQYKQSLLIQNPVYKTYL